MAWRFKASKFKNSAPTFPKKEEWLSVLPVGGLLQSCGNHIKSSCYYMAFNVDSGAGGNLGVLPLASSGRQDQNIRFIHAHADFVTDFDFSPFDDCILATGSAESYVKIWSLPEEELEENITNPCTAIPHDGKRVENILWNPVTEGLLAVSASDTLTLYDVYRGRQLFSTDDFEDQVQCIAWRGDGSLIAATCKDKQLHLWDPRRGRCSQCKGHQSVKESRVLWIGNSDQILTTGFDMMRQRQIALWDCRNMNSSVKTSVIDSATGILMPFFDEDTNMLFFCGKGDNSIKFWELTNKEPYFTECGNDRAEQIKGAAMVPKRALDVMKGEVNRFLLLTQNCIVPAPYIVPRKSYREFHGDLFPDTYSLHAVMTGEQWLEGENITMPKVSLNPEHAPPLPYHRGLESNNQNVPTRTKPAPVEELHDVSNLTDDAKVHEINGSGYNESPLRGPLPSHTPAEQVPHHQEPEHQPYSHSDDENDGIVVEPKQSVSSRVAQLIGKTEEEVKERLPPPWKVKPVSQPTEDLGVYAGPQALSRGAHEADDVKDETPSQRGNRPAKVFTGVRQAKFRHLKGTVGHKTTHFANLRRVSKSMPGECDMFHVNPKFAALPLDGPGGLIATIKLSEPGKLVDSELPTVQNGAKVTDFAWDPFDNNRLAVSCDDALIRIWDVPDDAEGTMTEPFGYLKGHTEKIYFIRFHPLAKDVLASASYDMTVRIWDLMDGSERLRLEGHTDQIFAFDWSPDGQECATVCKDGRIRIYEPRTSSQPTNEGAGPAGSRGARIKWVLHGNMLLVSGFTRSSDRQVSVHDPDNLKKALASQNVDISPAILVPFYDEDSSVVLLTGRGDCTVFSFEVSSEYPHLFQLASCKPEGLHQAVAYLKKDQIDVRKVEFARAYRLTSNSIEPLSFTVPRVKLDYFQDDLFPDTRVLWMPAMNSQQWFCGLNTQARTMCLQPPDMQPLTGTAVDTPGKTRKYESYTPETYKSNKQKEQALVAAIDEKLQHDDKPLPQDLTEGVDSDEWNSEEDDNV